MMWWKPTKPMWHTLLTYVIQNVSKRVRVRVRLRKLKLRKIHNSRFHFRPLLIASSVSLVGENNIWLSKKTNCQPVDRLFLPLFVIVTRNQSWLFTSVCCITWIKLSHCVRYICDSDGGERHQILSSVPQRFVIVLNERPQVVKVTFCTFKSRS